MPAKTISQLTQATTIASGDEFAVEQSGVTKRIAASVVRGDIANANISASAAIAHSKLAPLNSAQILVGNGSNVPTAVSVTGDVTISNAGVTSIAAGAIATADIADAAVTPAKLSQKLTFATEQASTSGTSIDFTGIPSWARRITVMLQGVSTSGTANVRIVLGDAGGFETTGYMSAGGYTNSSSQAYSQASTAGFDLNGDSGASGERSGIIEFINLSGNNWCCSGKLASGIGGVSNGVLLFVSGHKQLSEKLDKIRVTTTNGADTFDAGSINIAYQG